MRILFIHPNYHSGGAEWDVWTQGSTALQWVLGGWLVLLTAIYAWATVAFGIRFSNLTHRGILTHGPYRWTRHPAYLTKNLFWWFSSLPFLTTTGSLTDMVRNCALLGVTNAVYYWRAKTEEQHLSADPAYQAYSDWMARHAVDFWITTEDIPRPENRVTVDSGGRIHVTYSTVNDEPHRRLLGRLQGLLTHLGLEVSVHGVDPHEGDDERRPVPAHPLPQPPPGGDRQEDEDEVPGHRGDADRSQERHRAASHAGVRRRRGRSGSRGRRRCRCRR